MKKFIERLKEKVMKFKEKRKRSEFKPKNLVADISVIGLAFVFVASVLGTLSLINNSKLDRFNPSNVELVKALTYNELMAGSEDVLGTENVKFSAYFLYDLDEDGTDEKVDGTCRQIGNQDALYMTVDVKAGGELQNAKIEIDGKNFYLFTNIPKDKYLVSNVIGPNIKQIDFNTIEAGNSKTITGYVRSGIYTTESTKNEALDNNINNYTRDDNKIIFTGTYVDSNGVETPIRKEVTLTTDWYGEIETKINNIYQVRKAQDVVCDYQEGTVTLSFEVQTNETQNELLLLNNTLEVDLPDINGYSPISAEVTSTNLIASYDEENQKITITRDSIADDNGNIYSGISNNNSYKISVTYAIEAYELFNYREFEIDIPVSEYYKGHNNKGVEFVNPKISDTAEDTVRVIFDHLDSPYDDAEVIVGNYKLMPYYDYVVSKVNPMKVYNGVISGSTDDLYEVKWVYYRGTEENNDKVILKETLDGLQQKQDEFVTQYDSYYGMDEYIDNYGIYFGNLEYILSDDGVIQVYDEELGNLLLTVDKNDFNTYTKDNPFIYNVPVKHIRVEVTGLNKQRTFEVTNVKKLNDSYLTFAFSLDEFKDLAKIKSYMAAYSGNTTVGSFDDFALYELPKSNSEISISDPIIGTQATKKDDVITINAIYEPKNDDIGWQNGVFAVKIPDEIIKVNIKNVEIANGDAQIETYEYAENSAGKFIKIYTSNDEPTSFEIRITVDLTANPKASTKNTTLELYSYNEAGVSYYYPVMDENDINNDGRYDQELNLTTGVLYIMAPNSMVADQTISEFNNTGAVIISPNTAEIIAGREGETEKTAKISAEITNNYSGSISDVVLLGKIPFTGNRESLTNEDLGSAFTVNMTSSGITLPRGLAATVYYSTNENPSRVVDEASNGWTLAENVRDWTQIKTYLIDLGNKILLPGEEYAFTYTVSIPNEINNNEYSYATFATYFSLNTPQGKYKTQTTSMKVGMHISDKYSVTLKKYQKGKNKLVSEAIYSITEIKYVSGTEMYGTSTVAYTDENGEATFNNLYVDRVYEIKELSSPIDYELNDNVITIIGSITDEGELDLYKMSGTVKGDIETTTISGEHYAFIDVEDEVRARLVIQKLEQMTAYPVFGAKFHIDGDSINKTYTSNSYGEIYVSGLKIGENYTLTETDAEGYYLTEPITIKVVEGPNGYSIVQVGQVSDAVINVGMSTVNSIPTGTITIVDRAIPTFTLKVHKVIEGTDSPLEGVQFRLYKGSQAIGNFETDQNGEFEVYGLYQEENGTGIDQTYTLSELKTLDGYTKASDINFKVKTVMEGGNPTLQLIEDNISGGMPHTYSVDNDQEQITLVIENMPLFRMIKEDEETGQRLEGAKFAIYDLQTGTFAKNSKGQILGSKEVVNGIEYYLLETDSYGQIIPDLPEGLYRTVEVVPSDDSYDIEGQEYYFKVGDIQDTSGEHTYIDYDGELIISNTRKGFAITTEVKELAGLKGGTISGETLGEYERVKYGESNNNPIVITPDAGYEIINITVNGEEWLFDPNPDGSYTMPQFTNITEDIHVEVTFCLSSNKFTINKQDNVTADELQGAVFTIDKILGDPIPYHVELTTSSRGQAVTYLPYGTYTLVETTAPKGYKLEQTPQTISFQEGNQHEFTIEDEETAKVLVHHYIKGTETKVAEDELLEGNDGEEYYTFPKMDIEEYELELDQNEEYILPVNSSGQFTRTLQEVTYYYVSRHIPVTVHHYIEGTATKVPLKDGTVAYDETYYGQENQAYNTSPIADVLLSDDYELADIPENSYGTYQKPGIEVTYTYKKVSREVEIHKIDKDKTEVDNYIAGVKFEIYKYDGGVQGAFVGEYTTDVFGRIRTKLQVGTYILKETYAPGGYVAAGDDQIIIVDKTKASVDLTVENQKGLSDVIVHHYVEKIDGTKTTDKVMLEDGTYQQDERLTGQIDSMYTTDAKTNLSPRYKLSVIPDNASGNYGENTIEVTYYYKEQPGKVIVHHYIAGTTDGVPLVDGTPAQDIELNGIVGDGYVTEPVNVLEKYEVVNIPPNANGTFTPNEIELTYLYRLKNTSVLVHHYIEGTADKVPSNTGGVVEDELIEGLVDDDYSTSETQNKATYYELSQEPANKTGIMGIEQTIVTYFYKLKKYPYTVNYLEEGTEQQVDSPKTAEPVEWGTIIDSQDEVKDILGHNFERANKASLTIQENSNVLNLYYSKVTGLSYTVHYIDKDDGRVIKDSKEVGNKTFADEVLASSEVITIPGYNYDSVDKNILTIGMDSNDITIYYTKRTDLTYTVNYFEKDTTNTIKQSKVVTGKTLGDVVYTSIEITNINGFNYNSADKDSLTIEPAGNEINLYYLRRTDLSYKINYLEVGENNPIKAQKVVGNQTFEDTIVVSDVVEQIDGFNYDSSDKEELNIGTGENIINLYFQRRTDLTYKINYLDQETQEPVHAPKQVNNATFEEIIQAAYEVITIQGYDFGSADKEYISISTTASENVINLYYIRHSGLGYTVNYLDKDTSNPIYPSKTASNKSYGDVIEAQNEIITIYGYSFDHSNVDSLSISDEDEQNVINLYYSRKTGKVIAHYYEEGTTNKIADDIEYTGFVNDGYYTAESSLIPLKYELAISPSNKNGVFKEEIIDVNYYYRKKSSKVIVHHLEDPVQNGGSYVRLVEDEELSFVVDSTYETHPSSNIPYKYEVVQEKLPSNATGTMTLTPIEVTYYYQLKTSSVTVKYVDRFNNQELIDREVSTGKVDSPYHVAEKVIPGYTPVNDSAQIDGTYTVEPTTITFLYAKNINITINYYDEKTGELIQSRVDDSKKQGDTYSIPAIDIDNYVLTQSPDNSSGTLGHEDITVNFVYLHVTGGVIEKHVDYISGDILYNEVHTGEYGDEYHTSPRTFENYDIVDSMMPLNPDGQMLDGVTTVTYYYVKRANITVKYMDKYQGNELTNADGSSSREYLSGHEGDMYSTTAKDFAGYVLDGMPDNANGSMPGGESTVIYYYKEISGGLIINHINLLNNERIIPEEIRPGYVGEEYEVELLSPLIYDLISQTGEPTGVFAKQAKQLTFYYKQKAKVTIRYIDENTGADIINQDGTTSRIVLNGYVGDEYESETKYFGGYVLVEDADNKVGNMTENPIEVTYKYRKLRFNVKVDGKISKLSVNGVEETINGPLAKVEFKKTEANNQKITITYTATLTNDSEMDAEVILREVVPAGMIMDPALNPEWTVSGSTAVIETGTMEPGETRDYQVELSWNAGAANAGIKTNIIDVIATNNEFGFSQVISTDDASSTELIIAVSTGDSSYSPIAMMLLAVMMIIIVAYFRLNNLRERKW